jgi:hypothetical protein
VLTAAQDVHCRVDGWPAAFWFPLGDGEILLTTLAPRGWSRDHEGRLPSAMVSLASRFFRERAESQIPPTIFEPLLREQIGYQVPGRTTAATILALNCLGLLIAGTWLAARRRLDRLALVAPAVTIICTIAMIVIGMRTVRSVQPTLASAQLIRVIPQTSEAQVTGLTAAYEHDTRDLSLGVFDGQIGPLDVESGGTVKRVAWDDGDWSRWKNLKLVAGTVQLLTSVNTYCLPTNVRAVGRFGERGLEGHLERGPFEDLEDAFIAAPPASPVAVQWSDETEFVSGPEQVLARGQFMRETLLSDAQRQRQQLLRDLLNPTDRVLFPRQPSLFFWSAPLEVDQELPEGMHEQQTALVCMPLQILRTSPQTKFVLPSSFLRVESTYGTAGRSSVYDSRYDTWMVNHTSGTDTRLRFVVPDQVRPCRLESASLTMKLNIPSRSLKILGFVDEEPVELKTWSNPSGVVRLEIDRSDVLDLDDQGGLPLGIVVSETAGRSGTSAADRGRYDTWTIEYVRLDVAGETL